MRCIPSMQTGMPLTKHVSTPFKAGEYRIFFGKYIEINLLKPEIENNLFLLQLFGSTNIFEPEESIQCAKSALWPVLYNCSSVKKCLLTAKKLDVTSKLKVSGLKQSWSNL